MLESLVDKGFQVQFLSHALAILSADFPDVLTELEGALGRLTIPIEEIVGSGGGVTKGTQRLRNDLESIGWHKAVWTIERTINGVARESKSHEVDHVRTFPNGVIALEIEWNNKDPFFDRDLENFKRYHAEGIISAGIIVTRGTSLQDEMTNLVRRFAEESGFTSSADLAKIGLNPTIRQRKTVDDRVARGIPFPEAWSGPFVADKFGAATTHWRKLEDRVRRGVGNPCPLVLIGMPASIVTFGEPPAVVAALIEEGAEEAEATPPPAI